MKKLYAPWREAYAKQVDGSKNERATSDECIFCHIINEKKDEANFVLARYTHCLVMLNTYPDNPGHLLIVPYQHLRSITEYEKHSMHEVMDLISKSIFALEAELGAQGINVGLNMGKAAGAGIPAHLHFHVLPRWIGDTNFLPTLADTKQIPIDLPKLYRQLLGLFKGI
jgi:ATP adenylyltransferase